MGAPERALGKDYAYKADVWSVGMVVYELATGGYPYQTQNFLDLYDCLCSQPEPRLQDAYPPLLREFVSLCLTRDLSRRPDAPTLCNHALLEQQTEAEMKKLAAWFAKVASAQSVASSK